MIQKKDFNLNNVHFNKYENGKDDDWSSEIYAHYYNQEAGKIDDVARILYVLMDGVMFINSIKVEGEYQHLGIGSKLLEFLYQDCKRLGITKIEGEFAPADERQGYSFYTKHGFEIREETMSDKLYKSLSQEDERG